MIAWLAPLGALAALGALPAAIHLLSRRVRRERPFPAVALLARRTGGRAQVGRLRSWLALLARTLAVIALLLAASSPVWRALWSSPGSAVVIVLDGSASMHQTDGGTSAWTRAVGAANRLSDELAPRPVLLLVAGAPLRRSTSQPDADRGALRALLAEATPGWGAGAIDGAVASAIEAFGTSGGDLYVITDGSRGALAGVDPGALPAAIAWHHLVVGGGGPNCAMRALGCEPGVALVGRPLAIRAEVANHGAQAVTLTVRLTVGNAATDHQLTIAPGESASIDRQLVPHSAGPLELDAAIIAGNSHDALPADDQRSAVVTVGAGLPLRIYSDADRDDPAGTLRPLLAAANAAGLATTLHPGAALARLDAPDADAVRPLVLTAGLTRADHGAALFEHLRRGGVWLQVTASDADAREAAAGVAPPAASGALQDLADRPRGIRLGQLRLDHPLCAGLLGREALLGRLEAWRYRPAPPAPDAVVPLAWADGSAALALRRVGDGWWIQLGIGPADGDSNLAALELLPLLMAHLDGIGGPRRLADAALPCGTAVRASVASGPDGTAAPLVEGLARLDRPGRWLVDNQPRAAAIPAGESDLRVVAESADGAPRESAAAAIANASDRPLWPWCLLAAALLLSGELLLAGGLPTARARVAAPAAPGREGGAP